MTRFRRAVMSMILALFLGTILGCSGDDAVGPVNQLGEVRVTGIWIRDESGEILGTWGRPEDGGLICYPNPFNSAVAMEFRSPIATLATVWVSRALGPGESPSSPETQIGGAVVFVPTRPEVRVLFDERVPAGIHRVVWDGRDDERRPLPGGFYRIYAQVGEMLQFADVFMYREGDPVPAGMGVWLLL